MTIWATLGRALAGFSSGFMSGSSGLLPYPVPADQSFVVTRIPLMLCLLLSYSCERQFQPQREAYIVCHRSGLNYSRLRKASFFPPPPPPSSLPPTRMGVRRKQLYLARRLLVDCMWCTHNIIMTDWMTAAGTTR